MSDPKTGTPAPAPGFAVSARSAFGVNCIGMVARASFPVAFRTRTHDGVYVVDGAALRVADIADVLTPFAQPVAVVLDIGHSWCDPEPAFRIWQAHEIARDQRVAVEVHDMAWAGQGELLVLDRDDLGRLVEAWTRAKAKSYTERIRHPSP
ncbi:hypothetical protein [Streptomyces sp. SID3343]|uniref:hypothetical protein n=1 Tax=Streptomyces sp. SID3343 TaxID=2690260 RepID=UPI0013721818|nr:hypothetical protein [Streptomyces sp. SID3343]MYW04861.1 hypothetical protein [Streptomyces sp. SID3343]